MALTAKQLYLRFLFHVMVERTERELSQEEESVRAAELDRLWWALSPEEQDQINSRLSTSEKTMPEHTSTLICSTGLSNRYTYYRDTAAFLSKHYFKPLPGLMWPPAGCVRTKYMQVWLMPLFFRNVEYTINWRLSF